MTRIFVYGTLKRGYGNNRLLEGQTFVGEAETGPFYKLYTVYFPFLVERKKGVAVKGELWDVDEGCLRCLDQLERAYSRENIVVKGQTNVQAYLYRHDTKGMQDCGDSWPPPKEVT